VPHLHYASALVEALLGAQQTYQQAKLNLVQAQANRLQEAVALFQSLGGGYRNKPQETAAK
jgi:outer membrane protein TolC